MKIGLSPLRKQGSTGERKGVDSRFRGNDIFLHRGVSDKRHEGLRGAERRSKLKYKQEIASPSARNGTQVKRGVEEGLRPSSERIFPLVRGKGEFKRGEAIS